MLAIQLKYDLLRFSRELFYVVFTILVPPASYLFMGQLFGGETYAGNLSYAQTYTPSFILLITFGVIFFAFGFDQVMNRTTGVEKRILLSPVPQRILLLSDILKSIIITSFGFFLVYALGMIVYDLPFHFTRVTASYGFFILLNMALLVLSAAVYSFFKNMNSALVFSIVLFQIIMITGGFTMPVELLPSFIQKIAAVNPMYHMNLLFIAVWNGQMESNMLASSGYTMGLVLAALFVIQTKRRKRSV